MIKNIKFDREQIDVQVNKHVFKAYNYIFEPVDYNYLFAHQVKNRLAFLCFPIWRPPDSILVDVIDTERFEEVLQELGISLYTEEQYMRVAKALANKKALEELS